VVSISLDLSSLAILALGGLTAGVINTLAGGGSLLSVPLLVLLGLPGTVANGTNRVGVLAGNIVAAWRFRSQGVSGFRAAAPILLPVVVGSLIGAGLVSQLADETFERLFAVVMIVLLIPTLRGARNRQETPEPWPTWLSAVVFFAIGLYGGSFQAGIGIVLVFALSRSGYDLVYANSIKVVVIAALTLVAVPVFVLEGQVRWAEGGVLAAGFAGGGELGARIAVRGGERVIRPVLALAVVALAGRMLGFY
jgi:uncharacterized membrane protein YfcA